MAPCDAELGSDDHAGTWLDEPVHRAWLVADAHAQLAFFRRSLRPDGGFDVLDHAGNPLPGQAQELHTTTRLVHSYALAQQWGGTECGDIVDAGIAFLLNRHRDPVHGGFVWSVLDGAVADDTKLAYGHVFVLLAASSARTIGHPDADRLLSEAIAVIDRHFWDEVAGLLRDEFARDWSPFSTYRGFNANMHGVEAFLTAFEATDNEMYLERAGRVLEFFTGQVAPSYQWRLPEHYSERWEPDFAYSGDPMFRPQGTTPGHSLEIARLLLQHWDLAGRPATAAPVTARKLIDTALSDAWLPAGGLAYTLAYDGEVSVSDRYWWPVTEAIGAVATLLKLGFDENVEHWYRRLWRFAAKHFVDSERGGWFPEIDDAGRPVERQFRGKPDIYHALQADLFPLSKSLSRVPEKACRGIL